MLPVGKAFKHIFWDVFLLYYKILF